MLAASPMAAVSAGSSAAPIMPGSTIGVLGSGQLGRMMTIAAKSMGYRVLIFSPDADSPAGQIADREITGSYHDLEAIRAFSRECDVVTFEFENIPAETAAAAEAETIVRPSGQLLHTTQHRLREKQFLKSNDFPVTPFALINSEASMHEASHVVTFPAVLKTASWGYDGKGQQIVRSFEDCAAAWKQLKADAILEQFVEFQKELSVMVARSARGQTSVYPVVENSHRNHILDLTIAPADISDQIRADAQELARAIANRIELVGVMGVELFLCNDGRLLVNELAPRPHNSGHYTIEACPCSQFEQQVRAICGLPLGETDLLAPAAMANLLGDIWETGEPNWEAALRIPSVSLHLYGKREARPGRKMGHLTALGSTREEAVIRVSTARAALLTHR